MLKLKQKLAYLCVPGGLLVVTFLSFCFLRSAQVGALDSAEVTDVTVSVPVSCNMTGTVDSEHSAVIPNGTYTPDIGQTTLKVVCNDSGGFSIYAIGYTGENYGTTTLVGESLGTTISTGTDTSGSNSAWAMKVTKVTDTSVSYNPNNLTIENSFDNYHAVPSTYTQVASYTSSTDAVLGSNLRVTYAVYVSGTQLSDTYNGKVKYTLVHPYDSGSPVPPLAESDCPANSVCYAPNSGDIVGTMVSTGTPTLASISANSQAAKQTNTRTYSGSTSSTATISSNSLVTLVAPNYSRSGYGFAGWSTDFNADNSSTIYGPQETITVGD
ncbi:hypothetical protein IJG71_00410, partial [Candidatus Saccharibacteria bacterium]|nr:hypothetical protein [Candidatus Saccharibacteria bacterium]